MHQKYLWNYCRMCICLEFYNFFYTCLSEKGTVSDLHVCITEWIVYGICDMVDTVSVSLDNSVGRDHAASTKNSEEDTANCVYGSKCMSRIFVWNTLCPGTGNSFGLSFKGMIAWIIAGLPWDFVHGISNFFCGILIVPIVTLLRKLEKQVG